MSHYPEFNITSISNISPKEGETPTNFISNEAQRKFGLFTTPNLTNPTIAKTSQEKLDLKNSVRSFAQLNENWDGYQALPIYKNVIENTLRIIDISNAFPDLPNPEITPLPNGTISIEWEISGKTAYLEIGNTRYSGYIKIQNQNQKPAYLNGQAYAIDRTTLADIYYNLFPSYLYFSPTMISNIKIKE